MSYWRTDCRCYFSVKVGAVTQVSKLPLRKWVVWEKQTKTAAQGGITQRSATRKTLEKMSEVV